MTEVCLHLPEPPSENHYYAVVRGRKILSSAGRKYKLAVKAICLKEFGARLPFPDGDVMVQYVWTRGRKAGDLTNRSKALLDALSGVIYRDDSQITETHTYRRDVKGQPGMQVVVARANPAALFPFSKPPTEGETA